MENPKKIFFVSDAHLGVPDHRESIKREKILVEWFNTIKDQAEEIYVVGDLFDFWFEYKHAVPKGYVRVFGKLAELADSGISVYFFTGNHDLWMSGYFEKELNIPVFHEPVSKEIWGKKFYIAHGDGLGPGDYSFKFLRAIFKNKFCQWMFRLIHPDIGIGIANYWSKRSRYVSAGGKIEPFKGEDKEWLILHSRQLLEKEHYDFFVYGHRHLPMLLDINGSSFINLGDWISYFSYGEFDGEKLELKYFKGK